MAEKHEVLAESRGGAHQLLGRLARKEKHLDEEVSFSELATQGLPNSICNLTPGLGISIGRRCGHGKKKKKT